MGLHVAGVRLRGWFYSVEASGLIDQSRPVIFSMVWSDTGTVGVVVITGFTVGFSAAFAKRQVCCEYDSDSLHCVAIML